MPSFEIMWSLYAGHDGCCLLPGHTSGVLPDRIATAARSLESAASWRLFSTSLRTKRGTGASLGCAWSLTSSEVIFSFLLAVLHLCHLHFSRTSRRHTHHLPFPSLPPSRYNAVPRHHVFFSLSLDSVSVDDADCRGTPVVETGFPPWRQWRQPGTCRPTYGKGQRRLTAFTREWGGGHGVSHTRERASTRRLQLPPPPPPPPPPPSIQGLLLPPQLHRRLFGAHVPEREAMPTMTPQLSQPVID